MERHVHRALEASRSGRRTGGARGTRERTSCGCVSAWARSTAAIATPASALDTYDRELQNRVVAFQRRRALASDAIVGEETLAHLSLAGDPHPSLTKKP
jgi:murein L,D-transpeptidase YcbB/YkuD